MRLSHFSVAVLCGVVIAFPQWNTASSSETVPEVAQPHQPATTGGVLASLWRLDIYFNPNKANDESLRALEQEFGSKYNGVFGAENIKWDRNSIAPPTLTTSLRIDVPAASKEAPDYRAIGEWIENSSRVKEQISDVQKQVQMPSAEVKKILLVFAVGKWVPNMVPCSEGVAHIVFSAKKRILELKSK